MKKFTKIVASVFINVAIYLFMILIILPAITKFPINELISLQISELFKVPQFITLFLVGLFTIIGISIFLRNRLLKHQLQIFRGTLKAIPFIIIGIGIVFFLSAFHPNSYDDSTLNLNLLGIGASIIALGFAFLFVVYQKKQTTVDLTTEDIERLRKKIIKLESVIDASLNGSQKIAEDINKIIKEYKEEDDKSK